MAIKLNVIVQYNGGFLPDVLRLTHAPTFVWFDVTGMIVYYYYPLWPHAFGPKKIYFVPKILMKQPHDCSY